MFSKNSNWTQKYFVIQGNKLFIYKNQKYNKPEQVLELSEDLEYKELRKKDADGKANVFSLCPGKGK